MKNKLININLTWKKIIVFSIIIALYTAIMALLPFTKDTSFRDIAIDFDWWILFGVLIIINSKSPKDSALKCFVFFLISQPLIYLFQVPFSDKGFGLFDYYKYWFFWTLLTIPMGYIGYYIKKKNIFSMIILLPILVLLSIDGIFYFREMLSNFPAHLLSFIFSFSLIILLIINLLDNKKLKIMSIIILFIIIIFYLYFSDKDKSIKFNGNVDLSEYNINLSEKFDVTSYTKDKFGNVSIILLDDNYILSLKGVLGVEYNFTICDELNNEYSFIYYYDNENGLVLELIS